MPNMLRLGLNVQKLPGFSARLGPARFSIPRRLYSASTDSLTWDAFLKLRKTQRQYNVVSSVFTTILGSMVGFAAVSQVEMDATFQIYGFDPMVVFLGSVASGGALGYLAGPLAGSLLFKSRNRKYLKMFEEKNSIFLKHIIKNRVDASRQSFSNPVPDFYGEKITSLKEYKQWLRDCNAFRRKTSDFL